VFYGFLGDLYLTELIVTAKPNPQAILDLQIGDNILVLKVSQVSLLGTFTIRVPQHESGIGWDI
jgi:hypothetical protein